MTSEVEETPPAVLFCSKPTCPQRLTQTSCLQGPQTTPIHGALTLSCIHLPLALSSLSCGPCFSLTLHVTVHLTSLTQGSLHRGVYQNDLGSAFKVQMSGWLCSCWLYTEDINWFQGNCIYFEKATQMILLSAHSSFTPSHTALPWEFSYWSYYEIL